jgi:hypothetical protein
MAEPTSTEGDDTPPASSNLAAALVEGEAGVDLVGQVRRTIQRRQLSGQAIELFVDGVRDVCLKYLRLLFTERS